MAAIRTVDQIAQKWATVTPQRVADYENGVREPRTDWKNATVAAKEAWKGGIEQAIRNGTFAKGVERAGTTKWQDGALTKGVTRWGPGVALGQDAYQTGFAPFRDAISRVVLPARFPRRDPRNLERVKAITDALAKVKSSQSGG
ncbi:MAG: hypothetical protein ACE5HE_12465 [Phycisphaerae bacterium]